MSPMKTIAKNSLVLGCINACLLSLLVFPAMAQESVMSANFNATGENGMVSYSVGQVACIAFAGTDGTVTEGVQQPYEILFMDGIGNDPGLALKCLVYPNPAIGFVTLKIENPEIGNISYRLSNENGMPLRTMKVSFNETIIPLDDLAPATYFLTVFGDGITPGTYKIIKNKR